MDNIEKYMEKVQQYIDSHENMTEDKIIRFVYLDLGKQFKFNPEYSPFGNDDIRTKIYRDGFKYLNLNKAFDTKYIVCNSISRILTIVLRKFDIDCECRCEQDTITGDDNPFVDPLRLLHMYNVINLKDGKVITLDLQEDIPFIKMRATTPNYGLAENRRKRVIPYEDTKWIDLDLGYITEDNFYIDDYYKELFSKVENIKNTYDELKYILENINPQEDNDGIGYCERLMFHVNVLESYFGKRVINFSREYGSIKVLHLYRKVNNKNQYLNAFTYKEGNAVHVFVYNVRKSCYKEIDYEKFMKALENGLQIHNCKVPSVEKDYQRIRKNEKNNS